MDLRDDALAVLSRWSAPEPAQEVLRDAFGRYLADHADGTWRTSSPAHLTASALVVDAPMRRAVLVLHRKVRRWLQPGGHCEPADRTLAGVALREAEEETGIAGLTVLEDAPVDLDRHPAPCRPGTGDEHFDVRYLLVAPPGAEPVLSEESTDVAWFPLTELLTSDDASVARLAALALDRN